MPRSMPNTPSHIDPFADTVRIFRRSDTLPMERISPKGEFHAGELGWFELGNASLGSTTAALGRTGKPCSATSLLIVAGAAMVPLLLLALL